MFKFNHYKQSNGYQCELFLTNYYGHSEAPLIISKRFFSTSEKIKPWAISNVDTFLIGSLEAFFIRIAAVAPEIFNGRSGGDHEARTIFMESYWKLEKFRKNLKTQSTVWKKINFVDEHLQVIIDAIPRDKHLQFDFFTEIAKDIIKATKFLLKAMANSKEENDDYNDNWHVENALELEELESLAMAV